MFELGYPTTWNNCTGILYQNSNDSKHFLFGLIYPKGKELIEITVDDHYLYLEHKNGTIIDDSAILFIWDFLEQYNWTLITGKLIIGFSRKVKPNNDTIIKGFVKMIKIRE